MNSKEFIAKWLRYFAKDISKNQIDKYVVAPDFSWTYIKTHEEDICGPYFMKI